jgi:type II secretion system protein G
MKRAFTLIELLIVVAIIAILAAIAVPNFLEAQVRSKISRCKSDMRTIGTALESYVIDHNKYPQSENPNLGSDPKVYLWRLTTPIAYLSSFPEDPFDITGTFGGAGTDKPRRTYIYYRYLPANQHTYSSGGNAVDKAWHKGVRWTLNTIGPSRQLPSSRLNENWLIVWNVLAGYPTDANNCYMYIYDPSNGTTSRGYIIDTNKGLADGTLCR